MSFDDFNYSIVSFYLVINFYYFLMISFENVEPFYSNFNLFQKVYCRFENFQLFYLLETLKIMMIELTLPISFLKDQSCQ